MNYKHLFAYPTINTKHSVSIKDIYSQYLITQTDRLPIIFSNIDKTKESIINVKVYLLNYNVSCVYKGRNPIAMMTICES